MIHSQAAKLFPVNFTDNPQLFGFDTTERLVAVEFSEPDGVEIYQRHTDGSTTMRRENFSPFFWSADEGERLSGSLPLNHLVKSPDWPAHLEARSRQKGRVTFALSDPVQQFLTQSGHTLFKGMEAEELNRLQLDIETATTEGFDFSSAERDAITAIALSDSSGWEDIFLVEEGSEDSERDALEWVTALIRNRDPDVIEGHNIFKFDLPYLVTRAKKRKVRLLWGRGGEPLSTRSSRLQIAEKTIQYPKAVIRGRHIVDTWILAQYHDVSARELESFGLKSVARHFGVAEKDRVLLKGEEIQNARRQDPEAFRTYALQDVRETRALAALLSRSYFLQAQIFPYGYQDVILRGNATKIDALFLREYLRRSHALPLPPEPRPFEGGLTAIFATGLISDVWHCDVTSLYPSVMLTFGFTPESDSLGVFSGMLQDLRAFRIRAKTDLRAATTVAERNRLDALQSTFKILINSFYGYLGFAQGHFADFDAAESITAKGREILGQMVDWLNGQGARVIEIDTDGIYFCPPENSPIAVLEEGLAAVLPDGIEVEFDRHYPAMFSYKAKNYALLGDDGSVILKGAALKSRGMEPFLRSYLGDLLRLLLEGRGGDANLLRDELAVSIQDRTIPIAALAKTETLQDSLASYQKKIGASSRNRSAAFELALKSGRDHQAGDQIRHYITGTKKKVTAYENARLLSDWKADARDENVAYYIGKLDDLAKKFSEFLPDPAGQGDLFSG